MSLDLKPAQNLAHTRGFSTLLIPNRDPESIYSLDWLTFINDSLVRGFLE